MTQPVLIRKTEAADKAKAIYDKHGVTPTEVRAWAKVEGLEVGDRGRLHPDLLAAFDSFMDDSTSSIAA